MELTNPKNRKYNYSYAYNILNITICRLYMWTNN